MHGERLPLPDGRGVPARGARVPARRCRPGRVVRGDRGVGGRRRDGRVDPGGGGTRRGHRSASRPSLSAGMVDDADLVVCMAAEHRDAIARAWPDQGAKTFTIKELVRLLEGSPTAGPIRPAWRRPPPRGTGRRRPPRTCAIRSATRSTATGRSPTSSRTCPIDWRSPSRGISTDARRPGLRPRGLPAEGGPEALPRRAGPRGPGPRHRLDRARRLPAVLRRGRPRGRERRCRPRDRPRRLGPGRADRGEQGARHPGRAVPRPGPGCPASTTMPTCSPWGHGWSRPPTLGRSCGCGWERRSRAGATRRGSNRSPTSNERSRKR